MRLAYDQLSIKTKKEQNELTLTQPLRPARLPLTHRSHRVIPARRSHTIQSSGLSIICLKHRWQGRIATRCKRFFPSRPLSCRYFGLGPKSNQQIMRVTCDSYIPTSLVFLSLPLSVLLDWRISIILIHSRWIENIGWDFWNSRLHAV